MAAQEQKLNRRSVEAGVYPSRQDPSCRLCKVASETMQHIKAGCKMQVGKAHVASIVYVNIKVDNTS